jgi:hypothetical protein
MTKISKYGLISIGLVFVCGLLYVVIGLFHKKINPDFDAETDIKNGKVQLISFGLPLLPPDLLSAGKKVDSLNVLYGFSWDNRGCSPFDTAETREYNNTVIEYLSKRNGKGWWKKYNRTVDSIYNAAESDTIGVK